jgi:hypothetical protein
MWNEPEGLVRRVRAVALERLVAGGVGNLADRCTALDITVEVLGAHGLDDGELTRGPST